jgi:hypothetical protein
VDRLSKRAVSLILACVALVALAGCDPLDHQELGREIEKTESLAAEGSLLARLVAEDRTKATFVRVQAGELAGAADESAEKLNDAEVEPDLEGEVAAAIALDGKVSGALGDLEVSPGDESQGAQLESELSRSAARAKRLADSL